MRIEIGIPNLVGMHRSRVVLTKRAGRAEFSSDRVTDIWFVTGPSDYAGRSGSGPIRNESTREPIRGFTTWNGSFLYYFLIYFLCFLIKYLF